MNQEHKENILKQEFKVDHPNTVWVSDVTYYHYNNRTYYICVILDLYARKVVAHRISLSNSTQLTKRTFKLAYESRQPKENLLLHSDQGANYTSRTFMTYLKQLNVQQSFSRKGTPYDNSVCESFFANMKREELYRRNYKTETEFFNGVHNYIAFTILKDLISSSAIKHRINTRRCTISTIQTAHVWFKKNSNMKSGC